MSSEFDASQVSDEPIGADILADHDRTIESLVLRPNALANAKLHAENEMQRIVNVCNRLAWGSVPSELRAPDAGEKAALLARLSPEDTEKLMRESRLGTAQRALLARMADAQHHTLAQLQAERDEMAQREIEALEWAQFEAEDAAGKEQRYHAWRAARGS
ncbi:MULTISPECIES: hypothetical protein [Rhodomicrobium]|uniref:hypothetical protein n=1 Tax=Rhodomicrobium TaxID=1068 RepID=UPI000B4B45D3|nr:MULTISPECIES: hypothetical protein [Rhodomicrobium]